MPKSFTVGAVEKGKFADLMAVFKDALQNISEMQRVEFVIESGNVIRNDFSASHSTALNTSP